MRGKKTRKLTVLTSVLDFGLFVPFHLYALLHGHKAYMHEAHTLALSLSLSHHTPHTHTLLTHAHTHKKAWNEWGHAKRHAGYNLPDFFLVRQRLNGNGESD